VATSNIQELQAQISRHEVRQEDRWAPGAGHRLSEWLSERFSLTCI
jgi:hypothetical protein